MEENPQISEEETEDREWIESLEYVIENSGRERASDLLRKLRIYSQKKGVKIPYTSNTPYVNTISLARISHKRGMKKAVVCVIIKL